MIMQRGKYYEIVVVVIITSISDHQTDAHSTDSRQQTLCMYYRPPSSVMNLVSNISHHVSQLHSKYIGNTSV